jgi:hypothetical protein
MGGMQLHFLVLEALTPSRAEIPAAMRLDGIVILAVYRNAKLPGFFMHTQAHSSLAGDWSPSFSLLKMACLSPYPHTPLASQIFFAIEGLFRSATQLCNCGRVFQ